MKEHEDVEKFQRNIDKELERAEKKDEEEQREQVQQVVSQANDAFNELPETPKTLAQSVAAGALIGNFIPIPGVGAGIGALVGGAVGLWRLKNK
ncbi:MAG: hypothetical protein Q8Q54_02955 [Methylococcales bacterium]|nr:hypothetical protein [Methylococcales bacterium]